MFNAYPQDIRMWLQEKGGVEKMPLESFWVLLPSELWQMGYRRCDRLGTMPEHLPSADEQVRALYKENPESLSRTSRIGALNNSSHTRRAWGHTYRGENADDRLSRPSVEEQLRAPDKQKSVGRYTCEERYTPGC
jgi:hypothetical protein